MTDFAALTHVDISSSGDDTGFIRALHAFAIESHIYNMDEFRHAIERMTPRH
jgi:hypothetical protein